MLTGILSNNYLKWPRTHTLPVLLQILLSAQVDTSYPFYEPGMQYVIAVFASQPSQFEVTATFSDSEYRGNKLRLLIDGSLGSLGIL